MSYGFLIPTATVLSALASFVPIIGDILSTSIASVGELWTEKDIVANARIVNDVFMSSTHLDQVIGAIAYELLKNEEKRTQILILKSEDIEQKSRNLFQKITKFCSNQADKLDECLYGKLYSTNAAKLGHLDANSLIESIMKKTLNALNLKTKFWDVINK